MSKSKAAPAAPAPAAEPALPTVHVESSDRAISGWLSKNELVNRKQVIAEVMKAVMQEGEHFGGSYPGDTKKSLKKPGADTLLMTFQLYADVEVEERHYEGHHREYRTTARIKRIADGLVVAIGVGTCSTLEPKYRYRNAGRTCPECEKPTIIKTKNGRNAGGYWCVPDKGGCGANFNAGDPAVEEQETGKVEHTDPAELWNTCLKMGKKRAVVDGTISATGCSDIFSQDADELEGKRDHDEAPTRAAGAHAAPPAHAAPAAAPATPAPAAPRAATAAAAPAAPAVTSEAKLTADILDQYKRMQVLASPKVAQKVWKRWGKDTLEERQQRLAALTAGNRDLDAIQKRLGDKAEGLLRDILDDREKPDDVDGILADLAKAAGPAAAPPAKAAAGVDEPPY